MAYLILSCNAQPGDKPTEQAPIVGKWYCGMASGRGGLVAQYAGEGEFFDDGEDPIDMRSYGYLAEQF